MGNLVSLLRKIHRRGHDAYNRKEKACNREKKYDQINVTEDGPAPKGKHYLKKNREKRQFNKRHRRLERRKKSGPRRNKKAKRNKEKQKKLKI